MRTSKQNGAMRGVKILFLVMLVLAAIVIGIPWLWGTTLPVEHTASVSRELPAEPNLVWAQIADPAKSAGWPGRGVTRVEIETTDAQGPLSWREFYTDGSDLGFRRTDLQPPRRLVSEIADTGIPFGGTWTFELEPVAGGTRLTITEDGRIYNAYFRFVARYLMGHDTTARIYLDALEAHLAGPETPPEPEGGG